MPDDQPDDEVPTSDRAGSRPRAEAERRRRLDEVFGDVLPDTTDDERDERDHPGACGEASDRWLREQVPPHHG
jgi:hypothetical protein